MVMVASGTACCAGGVGEEGDDPCERLELSPMKRSDVGSIGCVFFTATVGTVAVRWPSTSCERVWNVLLGDEAMYETSSAATAFWLVMGVPVRHESCRRAKRRKGELRVGSAVLALLVAGRRGDECSISIVTSADHGTGASAEVLLVAGARPTRSSEARVRASAVASIHSPPSMSVVCPATVVRFLRPPPRSSRATEAAAR